MEENNIVKNEKWKKVLLTVAMVFQWMRVLVVILAIIFQKPVIEWAIGKTYYNDHFVMPIQAIITVILSSIIFFICYNLIKNNKDELHIKKEVISIVLLLPVYNTLNNILITIGRIVQYNLSIMMNNGQYNNDAYYIGMLESQISLAQFVFNYSTIILAIVAAILIGKKKK